MLINVNVESSKINLRPRFPHIGIIGLVPDDWSGPWQTRHYVMSHLANFFPTVWLSPASWFGEQKSAARTGQWPVNSNPNLLIEQPRWPRFGNQWLDAVSEWRRLQRARSLLAHKGCSQFVLYLWRSEFATALTRIKADVACYHIDDEYSFSDTDVPVSPAETDLIRRVDRVFVHSSQLMAKKGSLNSRTRLIPNGVEYATFSCSLGIPLDLAAIPTPRVGYVGFLKKQLDLALLLDLATKKPEWSFVLIGPIGPLGTKQELFANLCSRPNVYYLGARAPDALAAYMQHMDVQILPYELTDYTRFIYPLKLHEYLAAGRPVVGAPLPVLDQFNNVVEIVSSRDEWIDAIGRCLDETGDVSKRKRRQSVAQAHDWSTIVADIAEEIMGSFGVRLARQSKA